ncbi:S8 family serine peptidase [Fluviicola sp.]|uniref:S8 family serine peptidase n=1 Tax=Fluviicola sp. TaxID=1917219 RepID=UPI0031D57DD4
MKKTCLSIGLLAFAVCCTQLAYTQVVIVPTDEITPPNDPYYPLQWSHNNTGTVPTFPGTGVCGLPGFDMNIPEAWAYLNNRKVIYPVRVGILDSGLDPVHPDLNTARLLPGKNFSVTPYNFNTMDTYGHGTHVLGAIAATVNNGIGIAGVDRNCLVMPLKIDPSVTISQRVHIADAIRYAVNNNIKVINMSFGWNERTINNDIREAISYGIANGCTFVGAAGNFNTNEVHFPAKVGIAVGAANPCGAIKSPATSLTCEQDFRTIMDETGTYITWGSNYGPGLDVMGPGTMLPAIDIPGSQGLSGYTDCNAGTCYHPGINGDYVTDAFGTSIAAPYVTGIVSQMLSVKTQLKMHEVENLLLQASITPMVGGYHFPDAYEAIILASNYTPGSYQLADLAVDQVVYERINPTTVQATITVSNKSTTVPSDPTQLQAYLSFTREYNGYFSDNAFSPAQISIPAIAPGVTNTYVIQLPYIDYNPVDYKMWLNALVDPGMVQYETDDANNGRSIFVSPNNSILPIDQTTGLEEIKNPQTLINKPDLIPAQVAYSVNVSWLGKAVNMTYSVKNAGTANGTLYLFRDAVRYWDSYDATLSSDDLLLGAENMNGVITLTPGQEMIFPNKSKLASRSYLLIQVDAEYLNDESDETNNVYAIPLIHTSGMSEREENPVDSLVELNMELFPNPAKEQVVLTIETNGAGKIILTDLLGHTLQEQQLTEGGKQKRVLDTRQLSPGTYFVEWRPGSGRSVLKKLVIQ